MPVSLLDSELNIPGLYLFHDFVTAKEEEVFSSCNPMSLLNSSYIRMEFHFKFMMYLLQCSTLLISIYVCIYVTYFGFFRSSLQQLMKGLGKILQKEGSSIMAMNFAMRLDKILYSLHPIL